MAKNEAAVANPAFDVLSEIAALSLAMAKGLPAQIDKVPYWSGIGFELMGKRFVTPMGSVSEMLEVPTATPIPCVQPWVPGVSNVRGRLLPLFDLAIFFGESSKSPRRKRRVLALEHNDVFTGVIVDGVYGVQHFPEDSFESADPAMAGVWSTWVSGSYLVAGQRWMVFDPRQLLEDQRFMDAAWRQD